MWFNKESLNLNLKIYKNILLKKNNIFLTNDQYFFNNIGYFFSKFRKINFVKDSSMILKDLDNYYKLSILFSIDNRWSYLFFLKYHLFFNNLILKNENIFFIYNSFTNLNKKRNNLLQNLILNQKDKLNLLKLKNLFLFNILFYLYFIFLIDSYFFLIDKYINYIEYFKLFDLNFIVNFKLVLLSSLTYKQRWKLWEFLLLPRYGNSIFYKYEGRWIKNKDILNDENLSFINSLDFISIFQFWKDKIFNGTNDNHNLLNYLYIKYILNNNKSNYLDKKLIYFSNKKKFLDKVKYKKIYSNNLKLLFINNINKKKYNKVLIKGRKFKDPLFNKGLSEEFENILDLIFYYYYFYYIRYIYKINLNFLKNTELLYFKNSWKEKKKNIYTYILILFLKLNIKFKCKFKRGFYKLIFSLYFFLLKYNNKLDFNKLDDIKLNYFSFKWNEVFKLEFFNLFIKNKESNLNIIWNYRNDLLNKTIYFYYYKYWNLIYNKLNLKLKKQENKLKKYILRTSILNLEKNFLFLKIYELYKLGSYNFWSLAKRRKILQLKILYLNLFFKNKKFKIKKKKKFFFLKKGNIFHFFLLNYLINNSDYILDSLNRQNLFTLFDKKKIKNLYIYFNYLFYLKKVNKKLILGKISFNNISYYYLMKNFNLSIIKYLNFLIRKLVYISSLSYYKSNLKYLNYLKIKNKFFLFKYIYFFIFKNIKITYLSIKFLSNNYFFGLKLKRKNLNNYSYLQNIKLKKRNNKKKFLLKLVQNYELNFNKNLNKYKYFFVQDLIYYYNDYFLFCDDQIDLYFDSRLNIFKNNEILNKLNLDFKFFDSFWWLNKVNLINKKKIFYLYKLNVFKFIKKVSLLSSDYKDVLNLKFNYKLDEFTDKTFHLLNHDIKYKFNLDSILLEKALSYIDNKELLKRRKFNLLFFKKLSFYFLIYNNNFLSELELIYEDIDYMLNEYNCFSFKKKQEFLNKLTLDHFKFIDLETMVYLRLNTNNYFQLNQVYLNISFFINIIYYFINKVFRNLNSYILELNRSYLITEKKMRKVNIEYNLNKDLLSIFKFKYIEAYDNIVNLKKNLDLNNINSNLNSIYFLKGFIDNELICNVCKIIRVSKYVFKLIKYSHLKFNKYFKNLLNLDFKFCNICGYYAVEVCDDILTAYDNTRYFLIDWLNRKKITGFIVLNNRLLFVTILNDNTIVFKNIMVLTLKGKYGLLPFVYFIVDLSKKKYRTLLNPYIWTDIAFTTISWYTNKFYKDKKYLSTKTKDLKLEVQSNKEVIVKALYKNWLPKRKFWKSLTKEQRLEIKLKKQKEDLRRIGKKEV